MSAQSGDILHEGGKIYHIAGHLPTRCHEVTIKMSPNTACMRGYMAEWVIKDFQLFLISLDKSGEKQEIFANWVSEEIRIPYGEIIEYVHSGYETVFEYDMFLTFLRGNLIEKRTVDNRALYPGKRSKKEIVDVQMGLNKKALTVGKDKQENLVVIDAPQVDDFHCRIIEYRKLIENKLQYGNYKIIDCDSLYGTFVNGIKIEPQKYVELEISDSVRIGESDLEWQKYF